VLSLLIPYLGFSGKPTPGSSEKGRGLAIEVRRNGKFPPRRNVVELSEIAIIRSSERKRLGHSVEPFCLPQRGAWMELTCFLRKAFSFNELERRLQRENLLFSMKYKKCCLLKLSGNQ
jgi:hypothetical protein